MGLQILDAVLPRSVVLTLATLGAAVSALVVATTFVPGGPVVPTWIIWPLFLGCFPVHLRSIRVLPTEHAFKQRLLDSPRVLLVVATAIGACALLLMVHGLVTSQGNPERHGGGYYLRNHTELTRVSRAQYRSAERLGERFFSAVALPFYLLGILINVAPGRPARKGVSAEPVSPPAPPSFETRPPL